VLRWLIEKRIAVIPKSSEPERISANAQLFDFALDADDIAALDLLSGSSPN
jgi:2,5-diketo-D-gluconate reductase A